MIDARHSSEERYCKLSIAYDTKAEQTEVLAAINHNIKLCRLEPNIYKSDLRNNKKVVALEYHDDINRESGAVFDAILDQLHITKCLT